MPFNMDYNPDASMPGSKLVYFSYESNDGLAETAHASLPQYNLTSRRAFADFRRADEEKVYESICSAEMRRIRPTLGLPDLWSNFALSYCTDSRAVVKLIKTWYRETRTELEQAAILEDIYIR